jgi:hypothetical protein
MTSWKRFPLFKLNKYRIPLLPLLLFAKYTIGKSAAIQKPETTE